MHLLTSPLLIVGVELVMSLSRLPAVAAAARLLAPLVTTIATGSAIPTIRAIPTGLAGAAIAAAIPAREACVLMACAFISALEATAAAIALLAPLVSALIATLVATLIAATLTLIAAALVATLIAALVVAWVSTPAACTPSIPGLAAGFVVTVVAAITPITAATASAAGVVVPHAFAPVVAPGFLTLTGLAIRPLFRRVVTLISATSIASASFALSPLLAAALPLMFTLSHVSPFDDAGDSPDSPVGPFAATVGM